MTKKTGRASFHVSKNMRKYFTNIGGSWGSQEEKGKGKSKTGKFTALIEPFYLCMILGMVSERSRNPDPMERDMVEEWLSYSKAYADEISGLAFFMHCRRMGIIEDKASERVLNEMAGFFAEGNNTKFTREGYAMMNKYAQGGFDIISEELAGVSDLADFLGLYMDLLEGAL